jgi:hypothetical protein
MKKVLIGLSNNISANKEKINLWQKSFKKHSAADIVLIAANPNKEDESACKELGIEFHPVEIKDTHYLMHKRIKPISDWIKNSDSDMILCTDVFDVVFQNDPFKKINPEFDFFVGGEGINVIQDPWNANCISSLFENQFEKCANNEIICAGVLAGKRDALVRVYNEMYDLCEKSPDKHNIKDQASLIVLVANNMIPKIKIFNLDEGWVVHCAVAGPTQFFESWGFKNNLKYGIPKMIDGQVCTADGEPFDIVHQFNRIPEWNEKIKKKYL